MSLTATAQSTSNFTPCPAGMHLARCIQIIDLGTQKTEWQGQEKEDKKVRIVWETPSELITYTNKEGEEVTKPYVISKDYTCSLGEKARLRADLQTWRGKPFTEEELKGFNLTQLLGKVCQIQIIHVIAKNGNTYANIGSITPLMKGMAEPEQVNPSVSFDLAEFDGKVFESLPTWLQDKIKLSPEYKAITNPEQIEAGKDVVSNGELPDINMDEINIQMPF
jgi:hypothetical protein